jgi:hypothetical protein
MQTYHDSVAEIKGDYMPVAIAAPNLVLLPTWPDHATLQRLRWQASSPRPQDVRAVHPTLAFIGNHTPRL